MGCIADHELQLRLYRCGKCWKDLFLVGYHCGKQEKPLYEVDFQKEIILLLLFICLFLFCFFTVEKVCYVEFQFEFSRVQENN